MLTLHKATYLIKNASKWTLIFGATILTFIFLIRIAINLKEQFFPTPKTPPNVLFGKLPEIIFPASTTNEDLNFSVDTLSGQLPTLSDRANVYKIVSDNPNLLGIKKLQDNVKKIKFNPKGIKLSDIKYRFNKVDQIVKNLTIDTLSLNFNIASAYFFDKNIIIGKNIPTEEEAKKIVNEFLSDLEMPTDDIDFKKSKTTLLSLQNQELSKATSFSKTQIIRIDLFQNDIDKIPIFYPNPSFSTMNFLVSGGESEPQIVEASFDRYKVSSDSATYPILTADEAINELKQKKAYVNLNGEKSKEVKIKEVFLAYYLPKEKPDYLMPIIVFKNSEGFFAYVSATRKEWIQKPSNN